MQDVLLLAQGDFYQRQVPIDDSDEIKQLGYSVQETAKKYVILLRMVVLDDLYQENRGGRHG